MPSKEPLRSKYFPVPEASPRDSKRQGSLLQEYVRRMKVGEYPQWEEPCM